MMTKLIVGLGAQRSYARLSDDDEVDRRTDVVSRSRVAAIAAAALLFIAFIWVRGRLASFAIRADVIVSMAIGVALLGVMVGVAVTARPSTRAMFVVAGI